MAKTVNLGDKYLHRITLRLTDDQFNFILGVSEILGVTPSEYLRMTINAGMMAEKKGKVGTLNEDVKTNSNDKL